MKENGVNNNELDLIELLKSVWIKKRLIAKTTISFMLLGIVLAATNPTEYTTSATLIPETAENEPGFSGAIGGLASLAGIDLGGLSNSGTINPGLYNSIAQSTPFLLDLMYEKFYFNDLEMEITLYEYILDHRKTSLIQKALSMQFILKNLIKQRGEIDDAERTIDDGIYRLNEYEQYVIEALADRISVTMDWDLNVVVIEIEFQDPQVTAQIGQFTMDYITKYVIDYSLAKSKEKLDFVQLQYEKKKKEFDGSQMRLALFKDQNVNVTTERARSEIDRLDSENQLAFGVYNQLAQQREAAMIQVNENTPVFTILEPVKVPLKKSKPKRVVTVLLFTCVGFLLSFGLFFLKELHV